MSTEMSDPQECDEEVPRNTEDFLYLGTGQSLCIRIEMFLYEIVYFQIVKVEKMNRYLYI